MNTLASTQLWWYVARAGGITAWALSALAVIVGLVLSGRTLAGTSLASRFRPNWQLDLHRFIGTLTVVFTAVHVLALVLDSYVHFGPVEVLVPFASTWRPAAVAWGVIATYLLVAVQLTSVLRSRIPKRVWRAVHLTSYGLYAFGTVHAFTAGTDTGGTVFPAVVVATTTLVAFLTAQRIGEACGRAERIDPRTQRNPGLQVVRAPVDVRPAVLGSEAGVRTAAASGPGVRAESRTLDR